MGIGVNSPMAVQGSEFATGRAQSVLPAIKMLISDWYVDEFGILTREITARD
jgi:hypothetical protein